MDGEGTVIYGRFPGSHSVPAVRWREGFPKGNLFPFAIKPDRHLTAVEWKVMRDFCDRNFRANYFISRELDYLAFRHSEQLAAFLAMFGSETPAAPECT